ncbi:MAG TPA: hypothetical protein VFE53_22065 [Mucilaginibacter sp.]|jgi:hypothetical protein|nr:hypothetical protein [Mucilaginibacter sp.]
MRFLILLIGIAIIAINTQTASGQVHDEEAARSYAASSHPDSVKLTVEGVHAFYQKVVKADSIPLGIIYVRAIQFMAAKNFQQNYGYQEEGKLIFTTSQDLNINPVYVGDENDVVNPYNAQFSIMLDLKNGRYRYTVSNVVFFFPTDNGNKRETLYDIYFKASGNGESRRLEKVYKSIIDSFEKYISGLVTELREAIEQKLIIYDSKF